MAIVISDNRNPNYNGNLSQVNGFYRVEAGNLALNAAVTSLTSTYNYAFTFANAGNCQGFVLALNTTALNIDRPIKIELQENVATVWTARTSKTLTSNEIRRSSSVTDIGSTYITPFKFDTPYAVTTAVGTWRFQITSTAGTSNWNIRQAVAGTPSFVTWCDNQVSFTSNTDQFVAMDMLYLDSATTLRGVLQTGDTVNAIAGWICSGPDRTPTNVSMLQWTPIPVSSYKVTTTGLIYFGATSGFRAGTSTVPIPSSAMGEFEFLQATVGTNTANVSSGFNPTHSTDGGSVFIYGEVPAVEDTELSAPASSGQPVVITKVSTGWVAGDKVIIGRQTAKGNADAQIYTISSVVGTTITLTTNLSSARSVDASIFRMNGYGFKLSTTNATGHRPVFFSMMNIVCQGIEYVNVEWFINSTSALRANTAGGTDLPWQFRNSSHTATQATTPRLLSSNFTPPLLGIIINNINHYRSVTVSTIFVSNGQGTFSVSNCIYINQDSGYSSNANVFAGIWTYVDNKHENAASAMLQLTGFQGTFRRNKFWGNSVDGSSATGAIRFGSLFLFNDWGNNIFDNNQTAVSIQNAPSFNVVARQDEFGLVVANVTDIYPYYRGLCDVEFENCKGNIVTRYAHPMIDGFTLRLTKVNQVEGNDRVEKAEGVIYKAGNGLSDTTKHVGNFCMKFSPYNFAVSNLTWEQLIPTENIQNKDMMVGVWVNISNSGYWGVSNQMPRLTVNYDNGTIAYAEAAQVTGWQFLFVPITPLTTYGQIKVTVSGRSIATAPNNVFYVADMSVLYPAGHTLALGSMNTWASALPVMPSISTSVSAADVWAADPTQFGASTVGDKVNKIKKIVTGLQ